jgi:hypothetical protein
MKRQFPLFACLCCVLIFFGCKKEENRIKEFADIENKLIVISNRLSSVELTLRHVIFNNSVDNFFVSDPISSSNFERDTNFHNGLWIKENWEWITNNLSQKNLEKIQDNILEIAEESYNEENVKIDIFSHNLYPIKTLVGTLGLSVNKVQNSDTNVIFDLGIINTSSVNISNITVNIKTKTKFERGEKNRKIYRTSNKEITNIKSGWKRNFEVIVNDVNVQKIDWATVSIKIGFIEFIVEKNNQ